MRLHDLPMLLVFIWMIGTFPIALVAMWKARPENKNYAWISTWCYSTIGLLCLLLVVFLIDLPTLAGYR